MEDYILSVSHKQDCTLVAILLAVLVQFLDAECGWWLKLHTVLFFRIRREFRLGQIKSVVSK